MKNIVLLSIYLFIAIQVKAQLTINYSVGYGTYSMSDMKDYLAKIRSEVLQVLPGLDIATTDNFPGYITHTFDIGYLIKKHEFGLTGSYLSTAGKISYADYSGKISFEAIANGYRAGLFYRNYFYGIHLRSKKRLFFYGEISPSLISTKIKIRKEEAPVNLPFIPENKNITNTSFSFLPQLGVKYNINTHIRMFFSAGYEINPSASISDIDSKINWSGLRIHTGIGYCF